ncbi:smr domain-containing protein [Colletotrichum graminicola M1.001]|uniref:Smr domain-containing protein n=1 Tax=Colletotrichum graminicola (strain M1.001 / M2 / FGSC 10212) TaxID=645133 RepID=E3QY89_COLGM|nr:smr domain-containing protein [Colletotrichum graminicola M1.001]EFQ35827.1 smr domain-containing protein [Colletotrichum graminicola M1.001]
MNTSKIDALVAEFPLLDPTVVIVIASEVDLDDANQLGQVRGMLQSLAQNVLDEEASGFNASGVPDTIGSVDGAADARDGSTSPSERLQPKDTDSSGTTLTSSPPSEPDYDVPRIKTFDGDSDQEKLLQLQDMFSDLKPHDVKFALKKAQGDFQTALETLLNLQFLESIDERPKGVDGFFQSENTQPSGKKKGKRKKRTDLRSDPLSSSSSIKEGSPMNDDNERVKKILFIVEKLDLPFDDVSDVFDAHKGSTEPTIIEFLDRYVKQGVGAWSGEYDYRKQRIQELKKQYRHIPEQYLVPLDEVTRSDQRWTEEVATLLNRYFGKLPARRLDINYRLTPLANAELEGSSEGWQRAASPKLAVISPTGRTLSTPTSSVMSPTGRTFSTSTSSCTSPSTSMSYRQAMDTAVMYRDASSHSYNTAGQVYKKGHLYRQAAGYYAERGREEARSFAKAKSVAADIHVASTGSATEIDLHGVEVADGVRIALERVWDWWNNLGEYRTRKAQEGFTIVTGRGLHSAGGVSRLRQGVIAALVNDGWKVSVETGSYRVTGRR